MSAQLRSRRVIALAPVLVGLLAAGCESSGGSGATTTETTTATTTATTTTTATATVTATATPPPTATPTTTTPTTTTPTTTTSAATGSPRPTRPAGAGVTRQQARQIALAHIGHGRVTGIEREDDFGAMWEVEITRPDGTEVDVYVAADGRVVHTT